VALAQQGRLQRLVFFILNKKKGKDVSLESLAKHAETRLIPKFTLRAQNPVDYIRQRYKCSKCGATSVYISQTTLILNHKTAFTRYMNKIIEGEVGTELLKKYFLRASKKIFCTLLKITNSA
jgi:transposase-like protein